MSGTTLALDRRTTGYLARAADIIELTRPRIALLILITVGSAACVARWGEPDPWLLFHAVWGTLLVAASASALNQWIERERDARMPRTADRPLPAGRLSPSAVLGFGLLTGLAGITYLVVFTRWQAATWALATWCLYVLLYTPLKARTPWNTAVGAVAGALPILIGWTAVDGSGPATGDPRALALVLLLFFWQFPHFMAIAWLYRHQYRAAGMRMWTVVDPSGGRAAFHAVLSALALLPTSFIPALLMPSGHSAVYLIAALLLGTIQLACALWFFRDRSDPAARWLLRISLVYLPAVMGLLVFLPFA